MALPPSSPGRHAAITAQVGGDTCATTSAAAGRFELALPAGVAAVEGAAPALAAAATGAAAAAAEAAKGASEAAAAATTLSAGEIFKKASKRALGGGFSGAIAGVIQVCTLMWSRRDVDTACDVVAARLRGRARATSGAAPVVPGQLCESHEVPSHGMHSRPRDCSPAAPMPTAPRGPRARPSVGTFHSDAPRLVMRSLSTKPLLGNRIGFADAMEKQQLLMRRGQEEARGAARLQLARPADQQRR